MGVDVQTWCEVINRHPLKFKFEGLVEGGTDVREAAVRDEQFMANHMYEQHEAIEKAIGEDDDDDILVELYIDYLICELTVGQHPKELIDKCHEPDYSKELMAELEEAVRERRFEFAQHWCTPEGEWEDIRNSDPDWLLEKCPPTAVWSHAYAEWVDLEKVWFICPSCGNEPHTKETVNEEARQFYCGLCGGQKVGDDSWPVWFRSLEISAWPFMKKGDIMFWSGPDEDTCSNLVEVIDPGEGCEDRVSLRNAAGGEVEAWRWELRPSTVEEFHHFHKGNANGA